MLDRKSLTIAIVKRTSGGEQIDDVLDGCVGAVIDSTLENARQKESDNRDCEEDVRRRADRRCVGWLCRRGDRRLRACWPGDDGWWGGGGSGCGRAGRRAACGRRGRAGPPGRLSG